MKELLALLLLLPTLALAQYPSKPVRVIIHFPAGGSTDLVARVLAQELTASMGQPFVVENRTGADGAIAAAAVMQSPPDGHTLFIATNTSMMQVPLLKKNPPYDPLTAFTPVSLVGRQNPGKINFSTYSGASQLAYAQVVKATGTDMLRVPYKGEALAVTLPQRWPLLPQVPTTVEAGMPPINVEFFAALYGPKGMSPEIAARLSKALQAIIAKPSIREQIDKQGFALAANTPEELRGFMKQQLVAWDQGFKDAGIHPD